MLNTEEEERCANAESETETLRERSDDAQTRMHRANEESVWNVTQDVKERT